jgi:hypothetical protein
MNGGDASSTGADYEEDGLYELEGPLLSDGNVAFQLTTPSPMPVFLNAHYICESASRLLFLSVHWARSIGAFQLLSSDTQIELVRGCWSELFALGMAQCSHVMSLPAILTAIITHLQASVAQDKVSAQRVKLVSAEFFIYVKNKLLTEISTVLFIQIVPILICPGNGARIAATGLCQYHVKTAS